MMCDECGKRPATVHITKVINGVKSEAHLCQQCAQKHGQIGFFNEPTFTFHNILAGLFEPESVLKEAKDVRSFGRCPNCGLTFADFRRLGHLGCDKCYETFHAELSPLLRRIHGSTTHTGKVPTGERYGSARIERERRRLEEALKQAIQNEEYEKAAELRDAIRALDKQAE